MQIVACLCKKKSNNGSSISHVSPVFKHLLESMNLSILYIFIYPKHVKIHLCVDMIADHNGQRYAPIWIHSLLDQHRLKKNPQINENGELSTFEG